MPSRLQTLFKCKKCRSILAGSENVFPHWPQDKVTWSKLLQEMEEPCQDKEKSQCKNGVFIEPLGWMNISHSVSESRLHCAKCASKIGTFAWSEPVKCACGAAMAPGFLINLNRVDKCTMFKDIEAVI